MSTPTDERWDLFGPEPKDPPLGKFGHKDTLVQVKKKQTALQEMRKDMAELTGRNPGARARGRRTRGLDKIAYFQLEASVLSLYRDGHTQKEICDYINNKYDLSESHKITPQFVGQRVQEQLNYWRKVGQFAYDERMAMTLARLDQIEILATEAYFASMEGKVTTEYNTKIQYAGTKENKEDIKNRVEANKQEGISNEYLGSGALEDTIALVDARIEQSERIQENKAGDSKFLDIMLRVTRERASLWRLYDPPEPVKVTANNMSQQDREERLMAILNEGKKRAEAQVDGSLATPQPLGGFKTPLKPAVEETEEEEFDWDWDEEE